MRAAPPVHMVCGPDARWTVTVGLLAALAAATAAWWLAEHLEGPIVLGVAASAFAGSAAAGVVAAAVRRAAIRRLHWDGRAWLLDGAPGHVDVMIDLGDWMLLRFEGQGPAPRGRRLHWLPFSPGRGGSAAHLCRAVLVAEGGRRPGSGA